MRLVAVFVSFVALIAASVLAVAVIKLRRELTDTRADVASLRESCRGESEPLGWETELAEPPAPRADRPTPPPPRLAAAALAPAAAHQASAVPALASPEARAEVKKLVAEHLADQQLQREAVREQREVERRERIAAQLGLGQNEQARFVTLLTTLQAEWRQLREQARTGDKPMADVRPQMETARQRTDQALRELLGEEKMKQYQSLSGGRRGFGPGQGPSAPRGP